MEEFETLYENRKPEGVKEETAAAAQEEDFDAPIV